MAEKVYSVYAKAPVKPQNLFGEEDKIVFREEQEEAISKAKKYFEKKEDRQQFLWNAKMRFGKTLCALELARRMSQDHKDNRLVKRVLIVTHRPVVNESWKEDFDKIFKGTDNKFQYGTKFENDSTGNFFDLERYANKEKENGYVFFASMQYLRRSSLVNDNNTEIDTNNEKLRNSILENDWDLVVIDEAHEGTRTSLGLRVIEVLKKEKTKLLHLSGTPFNLYEDFKDEEIYNWDYVMEQKAKNSWDERHPGEYNPYAVLPHMNIFTYNLAELIRGRDFDENGAFKFTEFFRTWSGRKEKDGADMPEGAKGRFVHEADVKAFLDLMCTEDDKSNYPFSREVYQENFNHTLWIVPGVKEAKALEQLLKEHEIFGNFDIVNVAGNSDDDEKSENALYSVLKKIGKRPQDSFTITISCGRLTTGVTVPQWTAVLYLKGSENTSAATYMQTIFRVQSTDTKTYPGKMKSECYVFDFAPDRSLKMIAETAKFAQLSTTDKRHVTTSHDDDIKKMKDFLNFFSVISLDGGQMVEYEAEKLFEQLDHVYIDRVVRNGFNDNLLYNSKYIMSLDSAQIKRLNEIGGIIEKTTNMEKPKKAKDTTTMTSNGVTGGGSTTGQTGGTTKTETDEDKQAATEQRAAERKEKENRISIIRGIALRVPLMIYGAKVNDEEIGITVDNITDCIDDASWAEFMPRGITKEIFNEIKPCFNARMFALAGKRYRQLEREADGMHTDERVKRIAEIFGYFHNPDKETVLTPWRVVNMHMSDTLGGYCFFNETFDGPNQKQVDGTDDRLFDFVDTTEPRFVNRGKVTEEVFDSKSKILEINSKTGLYPLYVTYSIYRQRMKDFVRHDLIDDVDNFSIEEEQVIWDDIVKNNVYVICNTPMAARITERTLFGFRELSSNNIKEDKLVEQAIANKDALVAELQRVGYWNGTEDNTKMKFNAVVGNPPYQGLNHQQIYPYFYLMSKKIGKYVSLIFPTGWQEPKDGNNLKLLNSKEVKQDVQIKFIDNRQNVFEGVPGAEWVNIILWEKDSDNNLSGKQQIFTNGKNPRIEELLISKNDIIKPQEIIDLANLVIQSDGFKSLQLNTSVRKPYGFSTDVFKDPSKYGLEPFNLERENADDIKIYGNKGEIRYVNKNYVIPKKTKAFNKYKVFVPYAWGNWSESSGLGGAFANIIIGSPNEICTEYCLESGCFDTFKEAQKHAKFLNTRFARALLYLNKHSQHSTTAWGAVPILSYTEDWWEKSIEEIELELMKKYKITDNIKNFVLDNLQKRDESNIVNFNLE